MIRGLQIGAFVIAIALAGWGGWTVRDRQALREAAELREAQDRRAAEISTAEEARLREEAARIAFDRSMEDAAYADPVRYMDALSANRVRRLNAR